MERAVPSTSRIRAGFGAFLIALPLAGFLGVPGPAAAFPELTEGLYVEGMVVVRFAAGATPADRAGLFEDLGAFNIRHIEALDYWSASISRRTTGEAIERWAESPLVESIEPNGIVFADGGRPSDPEFPKQWHLENTGQETTNWGPGEPGADIGVRRAWCISQGHPDVVVAVLDTGVRWDHPDLAANIFRNPGEIEGNGIDDDDNGKVDDVRGWDFEGVSFAGSGDNDPMDTSGHGTLVAGVIAAAANGTGAVGVAPETTILPVRVLTLTNTSPPSGSHVEVALGILYAVDMGADILNCSFGSSVGSSLIGSALQYAQTHQVIAVCAAGNSAQDTDFFGFFPASYALNNVIAVAASTPDDGFAWEFSNWGHRNVDLVAPGVDVWSAIFRPSTPGDLYGSSSGTSFAAPQVAGAMALVEAIAPGLVYPTPQDALLDHVDELPELATLVASGGRLNVHRTLASISNTDEIAPATVDDLEVVAFGTSWVELEWTAPGDDGWDGTACCYDVRWSASPIAPDFDAANGVYLTPTPVPGGQRQRFRVEGLDLQTDYWFALTASDEIAGTSDPSNEVTAATLDALISVDLPSVHISGLTGQVDTFELELQNLTAAAVDWVASVGDPWMSLPVDTGSLAPGGTATVAVNWNAIGQGAGILSGTVTLATADGLQSIDVPVEVTLGAAPDAAYSPGAIDFGRRYLGFPATVGLTVRNDGSAPLDVSDITGPAAGDGFSVSPASLTVPVGGEAIVAVEFAADTPGSSSVDLTLWSNDPFDPSHVIPVVAYAERPPILELSIDSIVAEAITGEAVDPVPFTIRNLETDGADLQVSLAVTDLGHAEGGGQGRGSPGWLTVQPASAVLPPGGEIEVIAQLSTDGLDPALLTARIAVMTNDPARPEVTIPVLFDVSGLAALDMDGATLDFGSIPVGTFVQRTLDVSNGGTDSLHVTVHLGGRFVAEPGELHLPAGGQGSVRVRYRPDQAESDGSLLRLDTNDAEHPRVVISVIGSGASEPVWRGTVRLDRRVVVPAGETLSITAGTTVEIDAPLEDGRGATDCAIEVQGRLLVEGEETHPVAFTVGDAGAWTGIIVAGSLDVTYAEITGATTAVHVLAGGSADLRCASLVDNDVGVHHAGAGGTATRLRGVVLGNHGVNLRIDNASGLRAGGSEPDVAGDNVFRFPPDASTALHVETLSPPDSPLRLDGNAWVDATGVVLSDANESRILGRFAGPGAAGTIVVPVLVGVPTSCDASPGPSPVGPAPDGISFATRVPNPTRTGVTIDYGLPAGFAGDVVLDIHDIRGARVQRLVDGPGVGGQFEVTWSLTDSSGRRVSAGVYFLRLRAEPLAASTRKLVVLR